MSPMEIPASAVRSGPPPEWGVRRTMTDFEAAMWRMEVDPRLRLTVAAVEVLDRTPDWDRFFAAHDWASRILPRVRMRVVDTPLAIGNPVWAVDPNFDLSVHVRRLVLPSPATFEDALEICQVEVGQPFDPARPPWQVLLIERPGGGPAVYLLKMHHTLADGVGGVQLLELLHSRRREATPDKWQGEPPAAEALGPWGALREQLLLGVQAGPSRLVGAARHVPAFLADVARDPLGTAADAGRYAQSLNRVLAAPPCEPSPLLRARSLSRRFGVLETTVTALKASARAAGGSLNDAYVAGVLGGIRRYHEAMGVSLEQLPMAMPINLRAGDNPMGGNRFAGVAFAAPVGVTDPVERIQAVREIVIDVREEPALDALQTLAPALSRIPPALLARWYAGVSTQFDLQVSNVPGAPVPMYLAGAKIQRMFPFGPLSGCPVMVVLMSYLGACCIGITIDPAAVTDPDLFFRCLRDGLDEVLAVGGVATIDDLSWRDGWGDDS